MRNLITQHWVVFLFLVSTLISFVFNRMLRERDNEVKNLKKTRQIDYPDDFVCLDIRELNLCVSCEKVFNIEGDCPHCTSKVNIPLVRITQSVFKAVPRDLVKGI